MTLTVNLNYHLNYILLNLRVKLKLYLVITLNYLRKHLSKNYWLIICIENIISFWSWFMCFSCFYRVLRPIFCGLGCISKCHGSYILRMRGKSYYFAVFMFLLPFILGFTIILIIIKYLAFKFVLSL